MDMKTRASLNEVIELLKNRPKLGQSAVMAGREGYDAVKDLTNQVRDAPSAVVQAGGRAAEVVLEAGSKGVSKINEHTDAMLSASRMVSKSGVQRLENAGRTVTSFTKSGNRRLKETKSSAAELRHKALQAVRNNPDSEDSAA